MSPAETTHSGIQLGELAPRIMRWGILVGAAGLILTLIIVMFGWADAERFYRSYLNAFCFVISLALGALFFTMLHHLTRAGWSVVLRRIAEAIAGNLVWIWILFIPVAIGMMTGHLYAWAADAAELHPPKSTWLNPTFWLIRSAIYFAVWFVIARYFFRTSVAQDESGDPHLTSRMQTMSAGAMLLYAFTQTFAAVDWMMTLEFEWFSTMFGVYYFTASTCGFFALLIICMAVLQRWNRVTEAITTEHYHDAGKLLFAFGIVFWAYIAYSQYMLIWYANIPEETVWFIPRQLGGWGAVSLFLLFGHFVGPFLFLISRHPKRRHSVLLFAAVWMLFVHFIDVYWLVMPRIPEEITTAASYEALARQYQDTGVSWHVLDLTTLIGLAGLVVAGTAHRLRRCALIPVRDPRLPESLAFENI